MILAGCQIIPIDLNFHLQKCLEIFDKNSADKIQSKNYEGGKSALHHANYGLIGGLRSFIWECSLMKEWIISQIIQNA